MSEGLVEWPGYCPICERDVVFREMGPWYRDQLVCTACGSIPRQRALMLVLSIFKPDWRRARLWEVAPSGPASEKLRRENLHYLGSQYWADVPPGTLVDGVRCENLERPTLADASFDLVVSSDVFEHVIDVDAALAQIDKSSPHQDSMSGRSPCTGTWRRPNPVWRAPLQVSNTSSRRSITTIRLMHPELS